MNAAAEVRLDTTLDNHGGRRGALTAQLYDVAQHTSLRYADVVCPSRPSVGPKRSAPISARRRSCARHAGRQPRADHALARGAGIDPLNAERIDLLELVWSALLRVYDREAALSMAFWHQPRLGDRRPIDPRPRRPHRRD